MVGLPPGIIVILSGSTSALYRFFIHLVTACLHSKIPLDKTYPWCPSSKAFLAASTTRFGVLKSGCPSPRCIIGFPAASNFFASAKTLNADSVPKRSRLAANFIFNLSLFLIFCKLILIYLIHHAYSARDVQRPVGLQHLKKIRTFFQSYMRSHQQLKLLKHGFLF